MVTDQALAELLIEKGIITGEEYRTHLARCMEAERDRYQEWLSNSLQTNVTLG